jgi:hypothetical protein
MYGDSFAGQAAAGPCAIPQNPETPVMRSSPAGDISGDAPPDGLDFDFALQSNLQYTLPGPNAWEDLR